MAVDQQTYLPEQPDQQLNLLGPEDIPEQPGEIQVAGGRGVGPFFVDLLKMLGAARRDPAMPPTPIAEQLPVPPTPEGKVPTYRQQREEAAARLLSPEGNERRIAERTAERQVIEEKLADPDQLQATARQALSYEQGALGGKVAPRALDEETAEETIQQLATPRERAVHLVEQEDFNLDLMTSGDDIKEVIAVMGERFSRGIDLGKRGVQTQDVTQARAAELLADEAGFTKRVLKRRVGELFNAEEMTAIRVLLQKASSELDAQAAKIAAGQGTPEDMIRFRRKMAITAGIYQAAKGSQTEIARAMNAFKIPVGMDPGDLRGELIVDMLNQSGGAAHTIKLAKSYQTAVKKGGRAKGYELANRGWASKTKDVFLEVHINGLLSWLKSDMKNILGNATFMTWQMPEDLLAGMLGAAERAVHRARRASGRDAKLEESMFMGEVVAKAYGQLAAIKEAFILAGNAFRSSAVPDTASKVEMSQFKAMDAERLGITWGPLARAVDIIGRAIRLPTTMLSSEDTWFKAVSQRGELYAQAWQKARLAHLNGETRQEAIDRGLEVMVDPRSVGGNLDEAARYNTMTTDLGPLGEMTRVVQRNFIGRMLVPFSTAPTNTLFRAAERHPGLQAINPDFWKGLQGKLGPRARQKATARLMMGSAATYAVYDLALQGRLTGASPRTQKERDMLPQGWQPYAFVLRGENFTVDEDGDPLPLFDENGVPNGELRYWNYAGIEPIGAFIGLTVAATHRLERSRDPEVRENILSATLMAGADYVEQGMPFIQGISAVMKTLMYDDISHLTDATAGSFIGPVPMPYGSAARNVGTLFDDGYKRRIAGAPLNYYTIEDVRSMPPGPTGELQYNLIGVAKPGAGGGVLDLATEIGQQQVLRLPFLRDGSDAVIDFDVLGQPKEHVRFDTNPVKATWNSIMPLRWTQSDAVPEYFRELVKLDMPISNPDRSFQGIELNNKLKSDLIYVAKNQVILPLEPEGRGAVYTFRQALEMILAGPGRYAFDKENPLIADKQSAIKRLETRFFEKAMTLLQSAGPAAGMTDLEGEPIIERPQLIEAIETRESLKKVDKDLRQKTKDR